RILEVAHPLLLFRVDANDGQSTGYVQASQPREVAILPITVEIPNARQAFAAGAQAEMEPTQQPGNRGRCQANPSFPQRLLNLAKRAVRPFQAGDRIAGGRVL